MVTESALPEFLLARYAEDESIALDVQHQALSGRPFVAITAGGTGVRRLTDPGWWLDDLAAKKRIVEMVAAEDDGTADPRALVLGDGVLLMLALPYADHPDYREEWRP